MTSGYNNDEIFTYQKLLEILDYFGDEVNGSHAQWFWVLSCLKGCSPDAKEAARTWSEEGSSFNLESFNASWAGARASTGNDGRASIGSLIYVAQQRGYEHTTREWSEEEKREYAKRQEAAQKREAAALAKKRQTAAYILKQIESTATSDLTMLIPYFQNRGIYGSIRPNNVYWSNCLKVKRPGQARQYQELTGQLIPFTDVNGKVQGVHQTFINNGQKAKDFTGESKRMFKGPDGITQTGSALRLKESDMGVYIVAEGVENTWSAACVYEGLDIGNYAAGAASYMPSIQFPAHTKLVYIFADHGIDGEKFAYKAKEEYEKRGITAFVVFPPEKDKDWNDMLVTRGPSSFPALDSFLG